MAKKSKKIEKETRRLIEAVGDLVKKKGDHYKFKSKKKKDIKKVKTYCVHWIIRKGKENPTLKLDPNRPGYWRCTICGASFPIKPAPVDEYDKTWNQALEFVNQLQFWSVKLGGDSEDTKMFLRLKKDLPRMRKVSKQIVKRINQREAYEKNREKSDSMSQFDAYSGFNYHN